MIKIEKISKADAKVLAGLAISAFEEDKNRYGEYPPAIDIENRSLHFIEDGFTFKFLKDDIIIGGSIIFEAANGSHRLSCIFIAPEYQNQGFGQIVMKLIEDQFPDAEKWELDTPHLSFRNHHFYEKAGYTKTGEYFPDSKNKNFKLFLYEKNIKKA